MQPYTMGGVQQINPSLVMNTKRSNRGKETRKKRQIGRIALAAPRHRRERPSQTISEQREEPLETNVGGGMSTRRGINCKGEKNKTATQRDHIHAG